MPRLSYKPLALLPLAAIGLGMVTGISAVNAADLTAVVPGGATTNKFDFNGTFSIKAQGDGTIFVDFQPPTDPSFGPLAPANACSTEGGAVIVAGCTAALDAINAPFTSGGNFQYAFNAGLGALSEFTRTGAAVEGLAKDTLFPAFIPTGGSRVLSIPHFLQLDGIVGGLPMGAGINYFDVTRVFSIVFDETPQRTTVNLTLDGVYTGPATGPLGGSVSLTTVFDGLTTAQVQDIIFNPALGVTNKAVSFSGTVTTTPEPSSMAGLALVAITSGILLGKKKKDLV